MGSNDMRRRTLSAGVLMAGVFSAAVVGVPDGVLAQQRSQQEVPAPKPAAPPANPVGGGGSSWSTEIKEAPNGAGQIADSNQIETVKAINAYFNAMEDMQGRFQQTTSDNKRARGKFYVKRPGKFRFAYSPPSKLVILSDGSLLAVEDHDLKTVDKYPLDSTPFRLLLRKEVDLLRDAKITDLRQGDNEVSLTLVDKSGKSSGQLKLAFQTQPKLELKQWTITDAQGVDTRIEIGEISTAKITDNKLFEMSLLGVGFRNSN